MKINLKKCLILLCSMVLFIQPALDITYNVASASSITALSSKRLKLKKAKSDLKVYGFTDKELNSLSYKNILSLDKIFL